MTLPPHGTAWPRLTPEAAGFDPGRLAGAIAFAEAHESPWRRDLRAQLEAGNFEPPPDNAIIGPVAPRGPPNGLLLRHGKLVASWSDTSQIDMTFSVAKSYLSLLAGLAVADGLIPDLDDPMCRTVDDGGFEGPHNGAITWRQMLQLTSEWEGSLFGKSEQIDRNRSLASEFAGRPAGTKGAARPLQTPGTFWPARQYLHASDNSELLHGAPGRPVSRSPGPSFVDFRIRNIVIWRNEMTEATPHAATQHRTGQGLQQPAHPGTARENWFLCRARSAVTPPERSSPGPSRTRCGNASPTSAPPWRWPG